MTDRHVAVRPLAAGDAEAIAGWRYTGRDAVYDVADGAISADLGYGALVDGDSGDLVGFCCVGAEARVPGLDAQDGVLDVGVGLRPDLVGGGWGQAVTRAVLEHVADRHAEDRIRVAVLAWNERSLRSVRRAGFRERRRLTTPDGRTFVVLERPALPRG